MHASEIRPLLRTFHQSCAHGILNDILPFLRIIFAGTQPVMKPSRLKPSCVGTCFCEAIFPKAHPSFDGKFQISRRAEEMQMVWHQQVISDEPGGGGVEPDAMQRVLNETLCQPAFTIFRANGEENPIRSVKRNVNSLCGRAASRLVNGSVSHRRTVYSGERAGGEV